MLRIKEYVRAESLEQAYELNQKKTNRILGGMLWMRMGNAQVQKAIDLSGLGLDKIEEDDREYRIGCMVRLRELELHEGLNKLTGGMVRECVKDIVGVQFRNLATIGGSIFGRFGFSDVLTCFLALDTYVELYKGGVIPLVQFVDSKRDNDILVRIIVKKEQGKYAYLSHRNTKTDFPVLAVAAAIGEGDEMVITVGARPGKAFKISLDKKMGFAEQLMSGTASKEMMAEWAERLAKDVPTGSNMRATAEYRSHLAKVLIRRAFEKLNEQSKGEEAAACS